MLSAQDLMVILAIAAVLFGAKKLPELGRGIGEGIKNFKKAFRCCKGLLDNIVGHAEISDRRVHKE